MRSSLYSSSPPAILSKNPAQAISLSSQLSSLKIQLKLSPSPASFLLSFCSRPCPKTQHLFCRSPLSFSFFLFLASHPSHLRTPIPSAAPAHFRGVRRTAKKNNHAKDKPCASRGGLQIHNKNGLKGFGGRIKFLIA